MTSPSDLPTEQEFLIADTLDERAARDRFLGKSREAARALFAENMVAYSEDLMWMGGPAFDYYVDAAIDYLHSEAAMGDDLDLWCFLGAIRFRAEHAREYTLPSLAKLESACQRFLGDVERYGQGDDIRKLTRRIESVLAALQER